MNDENSWIQNEGMGVLTREGFIHGADGGISEGGSMANEFDG